MIRPVQGSPPTKADSVADLLRVVSEAYAVGSSAESPADQQRTRLEEKRRWSESLRYGELTAVALGDRRLLATAKAACDRARTLAVHGDSLGACRQIALAEITTAGHLSSQLARLLAATDVAATEAAVLYHAGDLLASQDRLFTSCRLDGALEAAFGLTTLHVHRIHLLGKMVQLLSARKLFREAMEFGATAILYLCGDAPPQWPLKEPWPTGDWDTGKAKGLPDALRSMLFQQLAIELGAELLHASPADELDALRAFSAAFPESLDYLCEDSLARAYVRCRRLAAEPLDVIGRLVSSMNLLAHPRREAETLWLLGALEAARCCASLDHVDALSLRARVFAELSVHTPFPPRLRECWRHLAEKATVKK